MIAPIDNLHIRRFTPDDAPALWRVFQSAVHDIACHDYQPRQLEVWAPREYDPLSWTARIAMLQPFVAMAGSDIAGYADLQPSGLIDHCFVAAPFCRQGIGSPKHTAGNWTDCTPTPA